MASSYIVQEEDGTSKFTLEEGGGSLLQEESGGAGGSPTGDFTYDTSTQWILWG